MRSKVNSVPNRRYFIYQHWDTLLIRVFFFGYLMFWAWLKHPDWPSKLAMLMMVPAGLANWLTVPATLGTAAGFGFFEDVLLDSAQSFTAAVSDKFPSLKFLNTVVRGQLPTYDSSVVNVNKINSTDDGK